MATAVPGGERFESACGAKITVMQTLNTLSPHPTSVLTPYTLSKIRTFQINHYGRSQRPRVAAVVPVSAGRGRATLNRTRAVRAVYNRAERSRRVRAQSPIREHARLAGRDGRPVRARGASGRKHHGGPGAERRSCSAKCNAPPGTRPSGGSRPAAPWSLHLC